MRCLVSILYSFLFICLLCTGIPRLCHATTAQKVRIGIMAPLTGKWAAEGEDARRLLELLTAQWNASGALGNITLQLEFQDDAGDPRTAALAVQKLIAMDVVAIISVYGSSVTEATQALVHEAGLVQFSSGATSVRLTEKQLPHFFRMGPRDDAQSRKAVEFLKKQHINRLAIVHDNTSHPRGFAEEVQQILTTEAQNDSPKIVFFDALPAGQRDYSAVLQKIRQTNPDLLLYTGYYPETALLLRQKAEMHWPVPMLGGDASNHQDLVAMAGVSTAQGYMFLSAPMPQYLHTPEAKKFLTAYTQKYHHWPLSVWSALSGDALNLVAQAFSQGFTTARALANYVHTLTITAPYPGLTGPVAFDPKGDRIGDLYMLYTVDKGVFVPKTFGKPNP
ncbi:MAG: branched-chain amino acid ABC transporter substrate-binding protein [Desulfovibrionaceae bacterium]